MGPLVPHSFFPIAATDASKDLIYCLKNELFWLISSGGLLFGPEGSAVASPVIKTRKKKKTERKKEHANYTLKNKVPSALLFRRFSRPLGKNHEEEAQYQKQL
ncbi:transmembrane protein, putative [Medicago truncatula]|uniref:Transmembrane protein, putative n=1 Tax=Medicago truncatula TaxID=3880 RepID=G7JV92_MEDTR|nr:transmembrane protein, putative [Medicago truncatula]